MSETKTTKICSICGKEFLTSFPNRAHMCQDPECRRNYDMEYQKQAYHDRTTEKWRQQLLLCVSLRWQLTQPYTINFGESTDKQVITEFTYHAKLSLYPVVIYFGAMNTRKHQAAIQSGMIAVYGGLGARGTHEDAKADFELQLDQAVAHLVKNIETALEKLC